MYRFCLIIILTSSATVYFYCNHIQVFKYFQNSGLHITSWVIFHHHQLCHYQCVQRQCIIREYKLLFMWLKNTTVLFFFKLIFSTLFLCVKNQFSRIALKATIVKSRLTQIVSDTVCICCHQYIPLCVWKFIALPCICTAGRFWWIPGTNTRFILYDFLIN